MYRRAVHIQRLDTLTLQVNFNQVYAHAVASDASWAKDSPGACVKTYLESFITYLKNFTEEVSRS